MPEYDFNIIDKIQPGAVFEYEVHQEPHVLTAPLKRRLTIISVSGDDDGAEVLFEGALGERLSYLSVLATALGHSHAVLVEVPHAG